MDKIFEKRLLEIEKQLAWLTKEYLNIGKMIKHQLDLMEANQKLIATESKNLA